MMLVTSVEKVTSIMGEISVATNEQSDGISQVNQAIGQMDMVTQQNASLVEQAAAAAARLNDQMKVLVDIVTRFRLENSSPRQGTAATPQLPLG
jgi:methyl-accepting chemotaxis protein